MGKDHVSLPNLQENEVEWDLLGVTHRDHQDAEEHCWIPLIYLKREGESQIDPDPLVHKEWQIGDVMIIAYEDANLTPEETTRMIS